MIGAVLNEVQGAAGSGLIRSAIKPVAEMAMGPIVAVPGFWRWIAVHNAAYRFAGRVGPKMDDATRTTGRRARNMNRDTAVAARLTVATDAAASPCRPRVDRSHDGGA